MRRIARIAFTILAIIVVLVAIVATLLSIPATRSAAVNLALRLLVSQSGFHWAGGHVTYGARTLAIDDLVVNDDRGEEFLSIKRLVAVVDPAGIAGHSDRQFGLHSLDAVEPHVFLRHRSDNTWNFDRLLPGKPAPSAAAAAKAPRLPWRFRTTVKAGEIDVIDPQALVAVGKSFSLAHINADINADGGRTSTGRLTASLQTGRGTTPMIASLFENDRLSFGSFTVDASAIPMAPVVDAFLPSGSFAIEAGHAWIHMHAYALGYADTPQWHMSGDAVIKAARLHVAPLIVPVRNANATLHFNDGLLSIYHVTASAGGIPVTGQGALQLAGAARIMFVALPHGRFEQVRKVFSFFANQDVAGPFSAAVRIDGLLSDARLDGFIKATNARFQNIQFPGMRAGFYISGGHVTMQGLDLASGGARGWMQADFDVASKVAPTQVIAAISAPASEIPVIANVMPSGTVQAVAAASGPFAQMEGYGFAQARGPQSLMRAFFSGGPDRVAYGPVLYEQPGSEAIAWADRTLGSTPYFSGAIVANHFPLAISAGRIRLPDITLPPISLSSLNGTFDGAVYVFASEPGMENAGVAIDASASSLTYQGIPLGHIELKALGNGNRVHISQATIRGRALNGSIQGDVAIAPSLLPSSGVLQGNFTADLSEFASAFVKLAPRGQASGGFAVVFDRAHWIAGVQADSTDASIGNFELRHTAAYVDESRPHSSLLANVVLPHGSVWAFGTLISAGKEVDLNALAPQLDLQSLTPVGLRNARGNAAGFATIDGSMQRPSVTAAATLSGSYDGLAYQSDLDMRYAGGTLVSNASRLTLAGNQVTINGNVGDVSPSSISGAQLALRLRLREGNLAALNLFTGKKAPLEGSYSVDAVVSGKVEHPNVAARIQSDIGKIRGVAFDNLSGTVHLQPGEVALYNGTAGLGSSRFGLNADATRAHFSVFATSPSVDASDFNDFFGGADVFAGRGAFDLALSSAGHGLAANGDASLEDAALYDYPLGRIDTTFSTRLGGLHAVVSQNGAGGSMQLAGTVGFLSYRGGFPDFATARYGVRAHVRDLQVDEVLPLIHREALGLTGRLNADGVLFGTLQKPTGNVTFELRDGYLKRFPIQKFSGSLVADERSLTLRNGTLVLPFLVAQGSGMFGFSGRSLNGNVTLEAANLADVAKALRVGGALSGSASGKIDVGGSLTAPRASADLSAKNASFYGVAVDEAKLHAVYSPGAVSFGDSSLTFAGKHGSIGVMGTLPLQLKPLALGPKGRPLNVAMSAAGVDLSVLNPIISKYAKLTGRLDAQASITGTAGNPLGKGSARIADASVTSNLQTVPVTDGSANLTFQNDTIALQNLHGTVGSGAVDITGAAHIVPAVGLRTYAGLQLWSRVNFHNAQVNFPNWFSGNLDGGLSFTRSAATPYLAGQVAVSNSIVPFSAIYELAQGGLQPPAPAQVPGVPPLQPNHTIVYGGGLWGPLSHTLTTIGKPTPAPAGFSIPSLNLNVAMNAGNNVRIRGGSSVDLTTTGHVTIAGNLQSPTLAGQFQAVRGQVGYFDTTFRLVSGTVTFDPTSGLLPTLNVTAVTNVTGAQITLTVTGRVDNLQTDLESNPSMTRDEIIAALLHTPQVSALTSFNPSQTQTTLVQTATNYFNAQLSRSLLYPVESALAQQLNIESISLIFNQYGELAVEVRTRFSPTVSAVYQSSVSVPVTSAYGMSYRLQDYLALDVLQTSRPTYALYSTVFNFRYTFE